MVNTNLEYNFQTGIPTEAWEIESHDDDLKVDLLQEFIFLDAKFQERVMGLQEHYSDTLR